MLNQRVLMGAHCATSAVNVPKRKDSYLKFYTKRTARPGRAFLMLVIALCMVNLMVPYQALAAKSVKQASQEVERANQEVEAAETDVTRTAAAYDEAVAEQDRLAAEISELNSQIEEINKELPQQEQRSDDSCIALYKIKNENMSVLSALLSAESITDAIALIDSYNYIVGQNLRQMEKTAKMKQSLEDKRTQVESDKADADSAAASASEALESAKAARQQAQANAAAAQKAEEEAEAKEAEEKAAAAKTAEEKKAASVAKKTAKKNSQSASEASADKVDWSSDKTAFVNKWTPRINAYLSGSPTAGTGKYYAIAAWNNGVDPRWAPAISCIESSKGAACFRSHNAWGYGGSGFSSWEEGINRVVATLGSSLYGGALTKAAAQTYCPPTWQEWYNNVASEMAKI